MKNGSRLYKLCVEMLLISMILANELDVVSVLRSLLIVVGNETNYVLSKYWNDQFLNMKFHRDVTRKIVYVRIPLGRYKSS